MYDPFLLLLVAVVLMIASVLWLRIHPFLALLAAALLVAVATPMDVRISQAVGERSVRVERLEDGRFQLDGHAAAGLHAVYRRSKRGWLKPVGQIRLSPTETDRVDALREYVPLGSIQLQKGDRLIAELTREQVQAELGQATPGERLARGLADAFQDVGLPVATAAIIGSSLMQSGGARRIVLAVQRVLGMQRTAPALAVSGFALGIPVFFDTVFYLLLPLAKTIYGQTRRHYVLYILSIVVGATMSHSLVPPTPGPLFVAAALNVKIGTMINAGLLLGMVTVTVGYTYARWADRRWAWQPAAEDSLSAEPGPPLDHGRLPSLAVSVLPIALPLVLLGGHSLFQGMIQQGPRSDHSMVYTLWQWSGDKHLVLMLAAALSLMQLAGAKGEGKSSTRKLVGKSLADGGVIILITCAGGAFGAALRESGIAAAVETRFPASLSGIGLLVLGFVTTALIRMAQGSATVAMITAAGIVGPLMESTSLPFHPVYMALAIGCGSKPFSWMNDSGFWVVSSMSGLDEVQTLKTFSAVLTLMGLVGFATTVAAAMLWPMAP